MTGHNEASWTDNFAYNSINIIIVPIHHQERILDKNKKDQSTCLESAKNLIPFCCLKKETKLPKNSLMWYFIYKQTTLDKFQHLHICIYLLKLFIRQNRGKFPCQIL